MHFNTFSCNSKALRGLFPYPFNNFFILSILQYHFGTLLNYFMKQNDFNKKLDNSVDLEKIQFLIKLEII